MDARSVQSSSKCTSSDFSINRILSETRSSQEEATDSPDWLCCTRYQPPRLPRNNISVNRVRRSGRHARVPFSGAQAAALEAAYSRAPYLAPPALRALAAALQLRDDRIKIWFQNRRARERREKNGNITPPRAVTLRPTAAPRTLPPQDLSQSWNRFQFNVRNYANPDVYRHKSIDTKSSFASANATSSEHCPVLNYTYQLSDVVRDPTHESNRCDSPLDVETVDN